MRSQCVLPAALSQPKERTRWNYPPIEELGSKLRDEAKAVEAVRGAVSRHIPELLQHLQHIEPEVRLAVAEALPCYPEHQAASKDVLERARAFESNSEVLECFDDALTAIQNRA